MNADSRVESPIPLLPLNTPDVETENLIKKKDDEVREQLLHKGGEPWLYNPSLYPPLPHLKTWFTENGTHSSVLDIACVLHVVIMDVGPCFCCVIVMCYM